MQTSLVSTELTAQEVITIIQQNLGVSWLDQTVDTFKTGEPGAPVTGIAVTMVPTLDVLKRAVEQDCNMVIAHEPLFFNHLDSVADLEQEADAVFRIKREFVNEHNLIIWRSHDHWHIRSPDGIMEGMAAALGWAANPDAQSGHLFVIPSQTVEQLARELEEKLNTAVIRVIGEPTLQVSKVAFSPGFPGFDRHRRFLQREDVEVLVIGEAHEWETIAYAADAVEAGLHKALIILGHTPSEQAGMGWFARWLQNLVPGVPIRFIPTIEPFWTLK